MLPHIKWLRRTLIASFSVILLFIGTAIISGIIGNRSDALFVLWLGKMSKIPAEILWPNISIFWMILVGLSTFIFWKRDRQLSSLKLNQRDFLLDTADSLLRLTPSLIAAQNLEDEIRRIVQRLLYRVTQQSFTSKVYRGLLLLPDTKHEYLVHWDHYGWMEEDTIEEKKFYIGPDKSNIRRGIAGETFLNQKVLVAHISIREGQFVCDRESYMFFGKDGYPDHRSLVCIPIVIGPDIKDRLGVICFDSKDEIAFDLRETQEMLQLLSRQLAAILLIYQGCKSIQLGGHQ